MRIAARFRSDRPADLDKIRDGTPHGWPIGSERFKDQIALALARAARPP